MQGSLRLDGRYVASASLAAIAS